MQDRESSNVGSVMVSHISLNTECKWLAVFSPESSVSVSVKSVLISPMKYKSLWIVHMMWDNNEINENTGIYFKMRIMQESKQYKPFTFSYNFALDKI